MDRMRAAVAAHPAAVPLFLIHRNASPASLRWIETTLGVLTESGFTGTERVVAQRSLVSYLVGTVEAEHLGSLSGAGTQAMAALPDAEFPRLVETARHARHVRPSEEFHLGLSVLIRGLQTESSS